MHGVLIVRMEIPLTFERVSEADTADTWREKLMPCRLDQLNLFSSSSAQPLHWVYNLKKLDDILGNREDIEFFTPSVNPYYRISTGRQSCYGDQAFVLLQSLVACKGEDSPHSGCTKTGFLGDLRWVA